MVGKKQEPRNLVSDFFAENSEEKAKIQRGQIHRKSEIRQKYFFCKKKRAEELKLCFKIALEDLIWNIWKN